MAHTAGPIGQIAIVVRDVDRALTFYRDVLGLKFLFSAGPKLAFLTDGSLRLMVSAPEGDRVPLDNSVLYFTATDVEATYEAMVGRGATAERAPHLIAKLPDHDLWIGFLRDPDGNLVGLMEEKRPAKASA